MTREEMKKKEALIEKYNKAYYVNNDSLVTDQVYDELVKEVQKWYEDNNEINSGVTAKVGSSLGNSTFEKVKHTAPMLSLANSYSIDEVRDFLRKYNIVNWIAEQKMDGLSLAISYRNGKLIRGTTRGDGEYGEDITEGVKQISNVPQTIEAPGYIEIRGEVLIPKETFKLINEKQVELGLETYKTSRNLASGTMRQLDVTKVKERGLRFVAYYIVGDENKPKTQREVLLKLNHLGFETPRWIMDTTIENAVESLKGDEIYDTDGVVFKNNFLDQWTEFTAKTPKWAFAYKYPTEQIITKLTGVIWQTGRTGKITPVACLEPVVISGTTVSRATLHNMNEIKRKDIRVNDYVVVEKAAEIIPQVVGPVPQKRSEFDTYPITAPNNCPECGGKVVVRDSNLYCIGPNCKSKLVETLTYFADRTNMNIQGLGRSTVEKLVDAGLLTDIASIYTLKDHRSALLDLDKLSEKSVDNLLNEIEKSRQNSFGKLLGSLGIETVGRSVGQALAAKYPTWKDLMRGVIEEFPLVKGVGHATAVAVWNFMVKQDSPDLIMNYIKGLKKVTFEDIINTNCKRIMDLHIGENDNKKSVSNKLNGKVFGFTGKLPVSRNIVVSEIESHNGQFSGTIGKKLDYLIVGLNPTAHKVKTAKDLGIKMISYEQFRKMVDVE